LSREEARIEPAPLRKLVMDRSRIVDAAQVAARGPAVLLDVRAPERYRGEIEPIDKKAGHIPGAINLPYSQNLDPAGRFRGPAELYKLYSLYSGPPGVIVQCGSGVNACQTAFAIELAGLPPARLYEGSFSGWIEDPSRPIAKGSEPG